MKTNFIKLALFACLLAALFMLSGCSIAAGVVQEALENVNEDSSAEVSEAPTADPTAEPTPTAEPMTKPTAEPTPEPVQESEVSAEGSSFLFSTVDEYLSAPTVQAALEEAVAEAEADGTLTAEFYADGSTLVYSYSFVENIDLNDMEIKDVLVESLAASCSENRDTFISLKDTLATYITDPNLAVRLEYSAADGSHLYSCIFDDSGKFFNLTEYLSDETVQTQLDTQFAALEGSGISMEVYAVGNTLVYDCTYETQLDLSDETVKAALVDSLAAASEETRSTYENIADVLPQVVSGNYFNVRLIYRNADGTVIYTYEYE